MASVNQAVAAVAVERSHPAPWKTKEEFWSSTTR